MERIIAVANQKGGVGKTTTAINLSACLAEMGKHVLAIDLDPQGNTTSGLGVDKDEKENTVYELLLGESTVEECIVPTVCEGLDLIPSNVNLSGAEIEGYEIHMGESILKDNAGTATKITDSVSGKKKEEAGGGKGVAARVAAARFAAGRGGVRRKDQAFWGYAERKGNPWRAPKESFSRRGGLPPVCLRISGGRREGCRGERSFPRPPEGERSEPEGRAFWRKS